MSVPYRGRTITGALAMLVVSMTTASLSGCFISDSSGDNPPTIVEANLDTEVRHIGGATTSVASYTDGNSQEWTLYNVANRLESTKVQNSRGAVNELHLDDYIQDILVIPGPGKTYALVALGKGGIALVDITDPAHMQLLHTTTVNFYKSGISFAEGGGDIVTGQEISGTNGFITSLATDGTNLFIGDSSYGIHETALTNIVGPAAAVELDGTLLVQNEVYTLQYAGENPWGGPLDLKVVGDKLYAAEGFLGIAVYSTTDLSLLGRYNMYTDPSVTEDWFTNENVADEVQGSSYRDSSTGMPNDKQASFEIKEVWKNGVNAPTPWADFDRYGKYYYNARALDVADFSNGSGGTKTLVYIAYGLGGLVAVDATNPGNIQYRGYAPAVPAHGPDEPIGSQSKSLFPHYGSGKLKESGVVSVAVDGDRVLYSDHFAGLVAIDNASTPSSWHGPNGAGNYDNDKTNPDTGNKVMGDHYPADEFVTSYDMTPSDPTEEESLPKWMFNSPSLLATGEISGHGAALYVDANANTSGSGQVDVVQATGAGGLNFIDISDLSAISSPITSADMANRFSLPAYFPGTSEIGAAADGSPTQDIALGHTEGVAASHGYLFVADGPHGMSVWKIADNEGNAIDDIHLVANTLQDEYPTDPGTGMVYPTPHAFDVELNPDRMAAFVLSQSLGLRRVSLSQVDAGQGQVGSPLLLKPQPSDFYEHNTEAQSFGGLHKQDHAYDVAFYGKYAVVADGENGLTVYNLNADPSDGSGSHVVANIGSTGGKAALGRATGVKLWDHDGRVYAIVAAGPAGVGVVDMTGLLKNGNVNGMSLIKVFEPIKIEDESTETDPHVGKADGRAVNVVLQGDYAYFSYDSFGIVAYKLADLIKPLPAGVDPTEIWSLKGDTPDYRPVAVSRFRLQDIPGYESEDGGALGMQKLYFPKWSQWTNIHGDSHAMEEPKLLIYAAYGSSGVVKIDWTDPANPVLLQHQDTVGEADDVTVANGRVYVADGDGGLVFFK